MPHTTRRRPTPSLKHQHLTTPDGWTHVFRGTSAQKHAPRPPLLSPTQLPHGVTLANVQETYAKYTRQWRESERCAELVRVLEREVVPGVAEERERIDGSGVRNCVVLGLGSLSGGDGREYSWWQLVALQTVLGVLRSYGHAITDVMVQDPRFNSLDAEFLSALSFTVVRDPSAFSSIGPTTFVYIPHGELEVTTRALEGKEPALYIGNDLDMWIENPAVDEGKKEVVQRWREKSFSVAQMGEQRVCGDLHMEGFYTAAHQKCNARLDLRSGATVSQSKYGIRGTENDFPRLEIRSNENDAEASPVSSLPQDANGVRRSQASKGGASILTLDSPALDTNYKYRTACRYIIAG